MQAPSNDALNRRSFLTAGAATLGATALSYGRIIGANDRISLGQIGIGRRGRELASVAAGMKDAHKVEMTAVCDLWKVNRERAAEAATKAYSRAPRSFQYHDDLLALKDVDAVIISTADFQHAPLLRLAANAGKDVYVEKPMANVLEEAKTARDTVRAHNVIVQVGTQHRSEPYQIAAKELVDHGALGQVSKVEMVWNYHGPRWRGRSEVKQLREEDTDWKQWLLTKPDRPFDPRLYFEFRLYRDFSSGIADQWMSHGIDLVHYLLDDHFPRSVVAHGGVYTWRDGRENPDTFQALLEYPKGFLVSYSTSFGNDSDSSTRIMGTKATLVNIGGEGSQRWKLVEEKGNHEDNPFVHRAQKHVTLGEGGARGMSWSQRLLAGAVEKTYGPLPFSFDSNPAHMRNWFECLRSRQQPNATVESGFAHSVAVIMAARAQREGKKLYWDAAAEEIVDQQPAHRPAHLTQAGRQPLMTHVRFRIALHLSALLTLVAAVVFVSPRGFVYDESGYMQYVPLLHRYSLSVAFLRALPGSAGPLHAIVHAFFEPMTHLEPWLTRMVSCLFFVGAIAVLCLTFSYLKYPDSVLIATLAIAIPMNWVIAGLALTESAAVFLATCAICCTAIGHSGNERWHRMNRVPLILLSGVLIGLAALGRQPFLLIGAIPFGAALLRRDRLLSATAYLGIVALFVLPVFAIWNGLVPPIDQSSASTRFFTLAHAGFSFGYAGLMTLLIAPRFFSISRGSLAVFAITLAANLAFGFAMVGPLYSTVDRYLGSAAVQFYMRIAGGLLLAIGLLFLMQLVQTLLERRHDYIVLVALLSVLVVCLSPGFIPELYSSRYTTVCWPFLLFGVREWIGFSGWSALRFAAGSAIGLLSLLGYYRFGLA